MALNEPPTGPRPKRSSVPLSVFIAAVVVAAAVPLVGAAAYLELKPAGTRSGPGNVTVIDDTGRVVTAPLNATRIVVLAPSVMDIVDRLGLRARVAAIGCPMEYGGLLAEYTPNQTALWHLNSSNCVDDSTSAGVDTEAVAQLDPQLVLAFTITSAANVDQLTNVYHIPTVVLGPTTIGGVELDVQLVAELFPVAHAAAVALEGQLSSTLANVSAFDARYNVSQDGPEPSTLLTYYYDTGGYWSYGEGSFGDSLISLAKGANSASSIPLAYEELNATVALNDQPAVILYGTSWNDPTVVSDETPANWSLAPYWDQLTGQKIAVDITLIDEPGPSMVLALPWFLFWLHPTLTHKPSSPP